MDEAMMGSPPRVRSRRNEHRRRHAAGGITSACAEQTATVGLLCMAFWDHLRVCGADLSTAY